MLSVMCGRYAASRNPDELVEIFEIDPPPTGKNVEVLRADYNVAPTKKVYAIVERTSDKSDKSAQSLPMSKSAESSKSTKSSKFAEPSEVADGESRRQLRVVRWGLVPSWAKDPSIGSKMINARMETVAEKPAYKRAFARRRCLLPADGYFEWYLPTSSEAPKGRGGKPLKQPYFISPRDGGVLAMAGLYEIWHDKSRENDDELAWLWTATVLTTTAEDSVGRIHDRMPLFVEPAQWRRWLDPLLDDLEEVSTLLVPAAPGQLQAYPVSTAVNSVRNNGPELLDPLPPDEVADGALF